MCLQQNLNVLDQERRCLFDSILDSSNYISHKIQFARNNHFKYGELAATADFLFRLVRDCPYSSLISQDNINEDNTGADFEWWIGSRNQWVGLLVQAKKYENGRYGNLRQANANGRQIDLLIAEARRRSMIPMYIFFEERIDNQRQAACGRDFQSEYWGASVAGAIAILRLVNAMQRIPRNRMRSLLKPATCLVACGHRRIQENIVNNFGQGMAPGGNGPDNDNGLLQEIPEYAREKFGDRIRLPDDVNRVVITNVEE